jgi:hypothetical protein
MLERVEPVSMEIPMGRMFYKADVVSSGGNTFLSRDAAELAPISGGRD